MEAPNLSKKPRTGGSPVPHRRRGQRGFALLLVFLMAAVIAITLYMEVPRVAMESERAKEQLLIDRGEQYKRAIQLFTKKAGRYPGDIKDLESFQNQRFLRQRYIDPMTGKDEWRVIHIQAGILTDSKVTKPQKQGEEKKDMGTFANVENTFGSGASTNAAGGAAMVQRRRASDGSNAGMGAELPVVQTAGAPPPQLIPGQQNLANPNQPNVPGQFGQPGQVQPIPGVAIPNQQGGPNQATNGGPPQFPGSIQPGAIQPGAIQGQPGYPNQPGQIPNQPGFPNQPGVFPGQPNGIPGGRPGQPPQGTGSSAGSTPGNNSFGGVTNSFASSSTGTGIPAQPGQAVYQGQPLPNQPGAPVNSSTGGVSPYNTAPGSNGFPGGAGQVGQPGSVANPQNQQATDMINRILTSPRPGGMPTGAQTGGATLGGGIAGVASNAEGEGVMVYNDHTLYSEWEFIYDPAKQKQIPNPNATGATGTPASQLGNTPGGTPGTPVAPAGTNPFGSTPPRPGR